MISVAVLIDHPLDKSTGGLVQCWKNLSKGAVSFQNELKLDLHFLGAGKECRNVFPNVRHFTHPPLFGTEKLFFLKEIPDQTDLSPFHFGLWKTLSREKYDLIHTTDTFLSFAKTGLHFSKWKRVPLTNSIQTDMPAYTRVYAEKILTRLLKNRWLASFLAEKKYRGSLKKQDRYLARCHRVLSFRRGIDKKAFHFSNRNSSSKKRVELLFVGRIDEGKNVMTVVEAVRLLLKEKEPIHLTLVGEGRLEEKIKDILGKDVTLTGPLPQEALPAVYAESDLFLFPSQIEIFPNVVIEAKASGLPVLMAKNGGSEKVIRKSGEDGIVLENGDPRVWAGEIKNLIADKKRLAALGERAAKQIETEWPSWEEVLTEDILPVWKGLVGQKVPGSFGVGAPKVPGTF